MRRSRTGSLLFVLFTSLAIGIPEAMGQWGRQRIPDNLEYDFFPGNCFTFCRVQYSSLDRGRRGWGGSWRTDYPDSDLNFSQRLSELTSIRLNRDEQGQIQHAIVRLTDDSLFNYPFVYMIEVGSLVFLEEEIPRLREYLLRGGFLMVDDFWGQAAWENFAAEMGRVLSPTEYPIVDIPLSHPIFHIVFDIEAYPQIPGIGYWANSGGDLSEVHPREPDRDVHIRGIFDPQGRLMVVLCHNTDLGDGWEEEAVHPQYFQEFSARKAYPLGINIVVYAMTH